MKECPKCKTMHDKPGTFCSRACANSRGARSEEVKQKISKSVQESHSLKTKEERSEIVKKSHRYSGEYTKIKLTECTHCGSEFWSDGRTWCKDECFLAIKRKNWMGNKQRYNDEKYDSSWEVEMVKWFEEKGIAFERPTMFIEWIDMSGKVRKYFPDFFLPEFNLFVDPKNKIVQAKQKEKLDFVSKRINLIYGSPEFLKDSIMARQNV